MSATKALLIALRDVPEFRAVMNSMLLHRPIVPAYRPQATADAQQMHVEDIKFQSAKQEGFDLLFLALTGKPAAPAAPTIGERNA